MLELIAYFLEHVKRIYLQNTTKNLKSETELLKTWYMSIGQLGKALPHVGLQLNASKMKSHPVMAIFEKVTGGV